MFLGVDLGTSSVKAVILDHGGEQMAAASRPLSLSRPKELWSEQDPDDWVSAAEAAVIELPQEARARVRAIGLSGQMHGATLLGDDDRPLRPAILWNDGRAYLECAELEQQEPKLRVITGNKAMPGFTAPKLAWVLKHEPDVFKRIRKVLLPKDYLRLAWTGDHATDMSDASGTLWLNVANRSWSDRMLDATGLTSDHMPTLFEGPEPTSTLSASAAKRLGLSRVLVAAGGGDQAAGAIGAGAVEPGEATLALGTSGVLFSATDGFLPNPQDAVHAFCHALPGRWHQMAVTLSAASAVDWVGRVTGFRSSEEAYVAAEAARDSRGAVFFPYLAGERTPHDDPYATGGFLGLRSETTPGNMVHAALEGVAFALADGRDALVRAGGACSQATLIGGGARSRYWGQLLASVLNMPLVLREGSETGPALGAARLARLCLGESSPREVCTQGPVSEQLDPDRQQTELYADRLERWRALYKQISPFNSEQMAT